MKELMAITIHQPWALAIATGLKRYESRSRPTSYRGPLAICASKRLDDEQIDFYGHAINYVARAATLDVEIARCQKAFEAGLWMGAVVAVADLVDCLPSTAVRYTLPAEGALESVDIAGSVERFFGDFSWGRFVWQFANVVPIDPPIEMRGFQGLWVPDTKLYEAIKSRMKGAHDLHHKNK